ncbi:MAG: hypothetical protein ACK55I_14835, partial [bacterium]
WKVIADKPRFKLDQIQLDSAILASVANAHQFGTADSVQHLRHFCRRLRLLLDEAMRPLRILVLAE